MKTTTFSHKGLKSLDSPEVAEALKNARGAIFLSRNELESLEGCPQKVTGDFSVAGNPLTSLVGGPKIVNDDYVASETLITSLEGIAESIGWSLYLQKCERLKSLKGIHRYLKSMGASLNLAGTNIESHILGIFKIKGLRSVITDDNELRDFCNAKLNHLNEVDRARTSAEELLKIQDEMLDLGYTDLAQL